jgi:uncharacterized damage-inducible protein DinB
MTDDLRYPIGPFSSVQRTLSEDERSRLIDAIEAHPARMRLAVEGLDDAQLDTPYREGGWTVRQVVHHVVDSHVNSYVRFRLGVTEPNAVVGTYQEAAWAELPDARTAPVEVSLVFLEALHRRWVMFLRALTPEDFARTMRHPEVGEITLDVLLEVYGWHCPHHEAHVLHLRNRNAW